MSVLDIVHDIQVFTRIWQDNTPRAQIDARRLKDTYHVVEVDDEEEYKVFSIDGESYIYMYGDESLYHYDDNYESLYDEEYESRIKSGNAYDFITKYNNIWDNLYNMVEDEMEHRGWYSEKDEYYHDIYKDGWYTHLTYYPSGDFDNDVGEFSYEPDEIYWIWRF